MPNLDAPSRSSTLARVARFAAVPADSPAVLYLAGLSNGQAGKRGSSSRRTMLFELRRAAAFFGHPLAEFPWAELQPLHVVAFRQHVAETRAPNGANLALSALRGVLRACVKLRLLTEDRRRELADVEPVRGSREPAGRALAPAELVALFAWYRGRSEPWAARDAAALALLYGGGLRRAEAVSLDLADFDGTAVRVVGKGNKARTVPLPLGAQRAVSAWIAKRGEEPGPLLCVCPRDRVIVERLSPHSLYHSLRRAPVEAGVRMYTPHDLRRTYVGDLLDSGADLATVQLLAGHSNPTTTARYDRRGHRARAAAAARIVVPFDASADAAPAAE